MIGAITAPPATAVADTVRDALQVLADGRIFESAGQEVFQAVDLLRTAAGVDDNEWDLMRFCACEQAVTA